MLDHFRVVLVPHTVQQKYKNVTVTKSLNQDQVFTVTVDGRRLMGYCPTIPGREQFLPLSGVPMEIVPEIQRQINELRGFESGEGPAPIQMTETGRTAAEQRAESYDEEDEENE